MLRRARKRDVGNNLQAAYDAMASQRDALSEEGKKLKAVFDAMTKERKALQHQLNEVIRERRILTTYDIVLSSKRFRYGIGYIKHLGHLNVLSCCKDMFVLVCDTEALTKDKKFDKMVINMLVLPEHPDVKRLPTPPADEI